MTNCSFQMKNDKNGWKKENYWKHPKKYFKQLSSACSTQKLFEINNNCTSFWFITKMSGILNIKDFHMKFVCSCWKIWKRTIPIADTKLSVIQMVSFFLLFKRNYFFRFPSFCSICWPNMATPTTLQWSGLSSAASLLFLEPRYWYIID